MSGTFAARSDDMGARDSAMLAMVEAIEAEQAPNARYEKAVILDNAAREIEKNPSTVVHSDTVNRIATLLTDRLAIVQICAAEALGYLGPRARSAVPTLNEALIRARRDRQRWLERESANYNIPFRTGPDLISTIERSLHQILGDSESDSSIVK